MSSLKERKEQFVSGLSGGSISEINLVTSAAVIGYLSWNLVNRYTNIFYKSRKWELPSLIIDFLLNWIGLLLSITLYSKHPVALGVAILLPSAFLIFASSPQRVSKRGQAVKIKGKDLTTRQYLPKKPFITAYRGGMLIITSLAILAVDFKIFPRRFAKVETWGTSLMDLGVGSFVFSLGVVSTRSILSSRLNGIKRSYLSKLKTSISSTFSVLILGLMRLFFVKNLEYQEHVTEYGVHWNFFITMVLVGPLSVILEPLTNIIPHAFVSIAISLTYEWFIVNKENFLHFLLLSERTDFLSSNREGIFSLFGYLAIFLAGQSTGFYVLPSVKTRRNLLNPGGRGEVIEENTKLTRFEKFTTVSPLGGLLIWFFIYTISFKYVSFNHDYNVSRRLANLPYVLWVSAYNTGFLIFYALIEKLFSSPNSDYADEVSLSLESVNSNGMIIFLLANVSTGLINMSVNTLDASVPISMAILVGYSTFLALSSALLYYNKIFIKL